MDYLRITESLKKGIEPKVKARFPDRRCNIELNHWHSNRFIQLNTVLKDNEIHYEYCQGFVELHLEGKYNGCEYDSVWRKLVEESRRHGELSWHKWGNRNQGRCRLNRPVRSADEIIECFECMSCIFDPILSPLADGAVDAGEMMQQIEDAETLPAADSMKVEKLTYSIQKIKDLPFENFVIPEYQRPYKWGVKSVNQLVNDLLAFRGSDEYRLGTLVLHENNVVDGQQRIVTLALLLYLLFNKEEIKRWIPYQEVQDKIRIFWKRTQFKNRHSIGHVRENLSALEERLDDLDEDFLDFLLSNCQFVVVQLPAISEAFQFFDSQNARGKDLEPHDLLKAFHLREIKIFSSHDSHNITLWQELETQHLVRLFLALYRAKRWSKSNSAKAFTKNDIDAFKGISLDAKRYPFQMGQIICHYFSFIYSNDFARKIDESNLEFPFQIDQICVNGSRFFDMIRHYDALYRSIRDEAEYRRYDSDKDMKSAYKIVCLLNSYKNKERVGDIYVRQLFDCLMMYYVDRFGFAEINKIARKIFKYTYGVRLLHYSVQLPTIDNKAMNGRMFKAIRDAYSPYDVINLAIPQIGEKELARNADAQIKELYF